MIQAQTTKTTHVTDSEIHCWVVSHLTLMGRCPAETRSCSSVVCGGAVRAASRTEAVCRSCSSVVFGGEAPALDPGASVTGIGFGLAIETAMGSSATAPHHQQHHDQHQQDIEHRPRHVGVRHTSNVSVNAANAKQSNRNRLPVGHAAMMKHTNATR